METSQTLTPWFRLVRLPNLLTVPGDPMAGFLLVAAFAPQTPRLWQLGAACGAALCLYIFGLILNDTLDIEVDRQERPERPLPSGQITVPQARMAAIAMALSAFNLALTVGQSALYTAVALAALILLYNAGLKNVPLAGVVNMGLCRGVSLVLGAVAAGAVTPSKATLPAMLAAACTTLYVTAFSTLAKREMEHEKPQGIIPWLPFCALLPLLPSVLVVVTKLQQPLPIIPFIFIFLMIMTLMRAWLLGGIMYRLQPVPATIGGHIRNLLMLQACLCTAAGRAGIVPAVALVLLSFIFPRLSARFYSS